MQKQSVKVRLMLHKNLRAVLTILVADGRGKKHDKEIKMDMFTVNINESVGVAAAMVKKPPPK